MKFHPNATLARADRLCVYMYHSSDGDDTGPSSLCLPDWERRPNRSMTSEQVTRIDRMISTMMIHVMPAMCVSILLQSLGLVLTGHLRVCDAVRQNLRQVEEHTTPFVQHLDARLDLEILPHCLVQGQEHWLRVPEEVWCVQHVGC